MHIFRSIWLVVAFAAATCHAQDSNTASSFTFQDIFATKPGDQRQYILLGGGWLLVIRSGDPAQFIVNWLAAHPRATVTPISRMLSTNRLSNITSEMVYIWVEDTKQSLNVDIVRAGVYPGGVMFDMVDNRKGLDELLEDPRLADAKVQIEKERAEAPQDRVERLIPDADYTERLKRIEAAETAARQEKLGIWSDAMKEEREADGYQ